MADIRQEEIEDPHGVEEIIVSQEDEAYLEVTLSGSGLPQ